MVKVVLSGNLMRDLGIILLIGIGLLGCNPNKRTPAIVNLAPAPAFNADSAYHFIEKQIGFGHRIPGTDGHLNCGNFIVAKLQAYGFDVVEQIDTVVGYDGKRLPLRNIIGKWNRATENRILLCAHWDSRPFADQDDERQNEPIVGANDNASGVAVLLEIARGISIQSPNVGVDMVFFDLEDQGRPASETDADPNDHGFCLGSKYWSENFSGVKPKFGVLLDMVGAKGAEFTLEAESMQAAPDEMLRIWDLGNQLGYETTFKYNRTQWIVDDHVNVNSSGIPCVAIVQYDSSGGSSFGASWHTHNDDAHIIGKESLKAVGQTILHYVYLS